MSEKVEVIVISVRDAANPINEEDRTLLHEALIPMVERFAELPDRIKLRVVTSLITSFCMNADDPVAAYRLIGLQAKAAIKRADAQEHERGGRA